MSHHAATDIASPYSSASASTSTRLKPAPRATQSQVENNSMDDSTFVVEELSDADETYPEGLQVLHPYELEEADSGTESGDANSTPNNSFANQHEQGHEDEEDTQDSDTIATPRRTPRLRWHTASGPVFASPSPGPTNRRKRSRSDTFDTDAESDTAESAYDRSEPPRSRRRLQAMKDRRSIVVDTKPSFNATEVPQMQSGPVWLFGPDAMDIDGPVAPAS